MDSKYNYFGTGNKIYMIIIAFAVLVIFFYGHILAGTIALIVYAFLLVYNIRHTKVRKDEWKKFIEEFSSKLDVATRDTLVKLPFPLIIIDNKGNIVWYNQNLSNVLEEEEILNKDINGFIREINVRHILEQKKNVFKHVVFKNKYYDIYTSLVDTSDNATGAAGKIILLYFYDVTEFIQLEKSIAENREVVMLLEVDNMDEVIKTTEEDKRPLLIADIERTINNYAQGINSMLKKYSSSKYILITQDKFIQKEMDRKFDILDTIREIDQGNKLAVTISIGIGREGKNPLENFNLANSAKELALGRGGDQVVVKSGEKLSFYGGKTKEVEKRTKVRARVIAHALVDLINESSKVFIMGHKNPDTDCFGAAIGINSVIRLLNKECYIVLDSKNNNINYLMQKLKDDSDYDDSFIDSDTCLNYMDENSLLIIVDVHNKGYVQSIDVVKEANKVVIIDHHRRSPDSIEGAVLSYIETYASSTSELVTEMLQYMVENPKIKPTEAEALLAGICVDTKNFYFKTGVRTFEAAGFLRRLGADTIDIKKMFAEDLGTYLKRAEIIKSAEVINGIAIATCPPEIEDPVLAAQAADELLNITGIQASFVLVKIEDEVFISGRSLGDVNVQVILETLGGGGHMTMAGAKLTAVSLYEAVEQIKNAIDKYLREGEKQ